MKWLLIFGGILLCCILLVLIIGWLLPVKHTATVQVIIPAPAGKVWQRITGIAAFPQWRTDVKSVESTGDSSWVEVDKSNHRLPFRIEAAEPNHRLVTRIDGKGLPFGGSWEYILETDGQGTVLNITENGEVYNPLFRFVSKFIIGHTATLKKYAADLERSFQ